MQNQSRSTTMPKPDELNPFLSFLSNDGRGTEDTMNNAAAGLNALQTLYTVDDPGNLSSQTVYGIYLFLSCMETALNHQIGTDERRRS